MAILIPNLAIAVNGGGDLITPLISNDKYVIFVNRGWVPKSMFDIAREKRGDDVVEIRGIVKPTQKPSQFVSSSTVHDKECIVCDLSAIEKAVALDQDKYVCTSHFVEAFPEEISSDQVILPIRKQPNDHVSFYVMPNTHYMYSATW